LDKKTLDALNDISANSRGSAVFLNESLSRHTTIRIGGTVSVWYEPGTPEELSFSLSVLKKKKIRVIVIGNGSNVLMPDGHLDAVVIKLAGDAFDYAHFNGGMVSAGAGTHLPRLVSECASRGLAGMEGLVGIPGTVGGGIVLNAGYRTSISDRLLNVEILTSKGRITRRKKEEINFAYRRSSFDRNDIIIGAVFELDPVRDAPYLRERLRDLFVKKMISQPLDEKTLGCVFRNPEDRETGSGRMIDLAGLKGMREGGAVVSEKHGNFIVNSGGATASDVRKLMKTVSVRVKERFSVDFVPEINILE